MIHGVGIIGCGNISTTYLSLVPLFRDIDVRACADLNPDAAQAQASAFGIDALTPGDLLARDDIDIVVNLTIPAAHRDVSEAALDAGKHVYSEKPFVLSVADGAAILEKAASKDLRVGSAPDTFLGGAHQLARHIIDSGAVGQITSGTAAFQSHGMEAWHPNPDFFFQSGGGPVLDMGPYYISNLVQLLGPVQSVQALSATPQSSRIIGSGPRAGEAVPVDTPTTLHALLQFHSGAVITLLATWDVWRHEQNHMELHGADGSLFLPDPNFFGGEVRMTRGPEPIDPPGWDHPLARPNFEGTRANYRAAGLADMAQAIDTGRPHRCDGAFAHHVVDVMTGILRAARSRTLVEMATTCPRPAPLDANAARSLLRQAPCSPETMVARPPTG
ncbi:MAG: Gfo/Idh/MocA family oxidoreductase [Pseudomonadota bacterium]